MYLISFCIYYAQFNFIKRNYWGWGLAVWPLFSVGPVVPAHAQDSLYISSGSLYHFFGQLEACIAGSFLYKLEACITGSFLYNKTVQLEACITSSGRGTGMNITAHHRYILGRTYYCYYYNYNYNYNYYYYYLYYYHGCYVYHYGCTINSRSYDHYSYYCSYIIDYCYHYYY